MVTTTSMKTMGNQQVTNLKLAWLSGIWDGEGTFGIYRSRRAGKEYYNYSGRLTLSNTSEPMIEEIMRIFTALDVKISIWRNTKARKPTHKLETHLTLNKKVDVKKLCVLMLPYLVAKRDRAELLIDFVVSRLSYKPKPSFDKETGAFLGLAVQGLKKEEEKMFEKMRELNSTGNKVGTSETTR